MKIKRTFIILAVIIFQTSCSQPDKTTLEGIEGLNTLPNNYFFELVNRFPLKSDLVKEKGQFMVCYLPQTTAEKEYWEDFLIKEKISPQFRYKGIDDSYYYTQEDLKKINILLKNRVEQHLSDYKLIGRYTPAQYLEKIEGEEGIYVCKYPSQVYYYIKKNDQWKFIKKVEVKDADTDESISKKEFLEALY